MGKITDVDLLVSLLVKLSSIRKEQQTSQFCVIVSFFKWDVVSGVVGMDCLLENFRIVHVSSANIFILSECTGL